MEEGGVKTVLSPKKLFFVVVIVFVVCFVVVFCCFRYFPFCCWYCSCPAFVVIVDTVIPLVVVIILIGLRNITLKSS